MKKITIAIDGYSSCGKSTIAKQAARMLGYSYVDSGAMYRAVALYFMRKDFKDRDNEEALLTLLKEIHIDFRVNAVNGASEVYLNGVNAEHEIRNLEVSNNVSRVSAIPLVRKKLVAMQQEMGKSKGVVMDGRDIGTVVFPDAELKLFMTADPEVRAMRRYSELIKKGTLVTLDEVRNNIQERDYQDTHRTESPLTQAADARVLDNTALSPEEQLDLLIRWAEELIDD